ATPDIYKRWAAFGLFSSHSRLHGNSSYRVPWLFDEESCDVLRFFTELKGKLMPYIFAQAVKTSTVGIPMMRAMVMEYASDPACLYLDKQYMFGDNILVAPILNETGDAEYYLPEGTWTNIISGKEIEGGRYIREKHDYFSIPALAKPNSIVAYGDFKGNFEYDYLDGTNFVIYALEDGKTASTTIYDKDANKVFELSATRKGNTIQITHTSTEKAFTVTVSNGPSAKISPSSSGIIEINL
ncbi:MAG: alpha-xylosidase, partial [Oscillospiraceae bacterium]|nr:alpha-xylosidase [Oscillospiraceae bacterium]